MKVTKTVSAMNARQQFGQLLDEVRFKGNEYIIEKNGQPAAVMISVERHESYLRQRQEDFDRIEALRAKLKSDKTLQRDIDEAAREVRRG